MEYILRVDTSEIVSIFIWLFFWKWQILVVILLVDDLNSTRAWIIYSRLYGAVSRPLKPAV